MPLPSEAVIRNLVARYARILAAHGEAFDGAELVTPTGEHFPDHFARDQKSVERLLARVASYTPLGEDVPLDFVVVESDEPDDGHCTTGCSKPGSRIDGVQREGDGYRVALPVTELGNPVRLVCALARGVACAVLAEAEESVDPSEIGLESEIVAIASGFGVVLLEGSHVYTKSCGGPAIHRGTTLATEEIATLLAFFCAKDEISPRAAKKHLGATQAEAFDEAWAFVQANDAIVRKLREAPELLEGGAFTFENKRGGLLSRLFSSRDEKVTAPVSKRTRDPEEERRLAEARALVEEELG
jgi:hypothetical protein